MYGEDRVGFGLALALGVLVSRLWFALGSIQVLMYLPFRMIPREWLKLTMRVWVVCNRWMREQIQLCFCFASGIDFE